MIVRTDDISITRGKRVNEKLYLVTLSRTKTSFHAKGFTQIINNNYYDIDMACIIMHCQDP